MSAYNSLQLVIVVALSWHNADRVVRMNQCRITVETIDAMVGMLTAINEVVWSCLVLATQMYPASFMR
jgi:hypothetical protein